MPLLPHETEIYPADLLTAPESPEATRLWWTFYTRVRQEKSLARELLTWKIPFYLPQVKRSRLYRGRKRSSYVPLFTSYLFVYASNEERIRALSTERVAQVLSVPDPSRLLRDLRQIQRLILADVPLTIESRLQPGAHVRVRSGVLAGIEGIVQSRTKPTRLVVLVNLLQKGVSLEVEDFLLDPLD